jgi:hypothetical protein
MQVYDACHKFYRLFVASNWHRIHMDVLYRLLNSCNTKFYKTTCSGFSFIITASQINPIFHADHIFQL